MDVTTQEIRFTSTSDSNLCLIFGAYMSDYERTMDSFLEFGPDALGLGLYLQCLLKRFLKKTLIMLSLEMYPMKMDQWRFDVGFRSDK